MRRCALVEREEKRVSERSADQVLASPHCTATRAMTGDVTIAQIGAPERDALWHYLQLYIYDMSQFTGA
jgi:hypothetical protein